jgi:hypothetical protein
MLSITRLDIKFQCLIVLLEQAKSLHRCKPLGEIQSHEKGVFAIVRIVAFANAGYGKPHGFIEFLSGQVGSSNFQLDSL